MKPKSQSWSWFRITLDQYLAVIFYTNVCQLWFKEIITSLINQTQFAFITGRNIADNVLLMYEFVVTGYNRSGGLARAILKVEIMKAYDIVE